MRLLLPSFLVRIFSPAPSKEVVNAVLQKYSKETEAFYLCVKHWVDTAIDDAEDYTGPDKEVMLQYLVRKMETLREDLKKHVDHLNSIRI